MNMCLSFQHLGDSTKILEDIANGKHPFAAVYIYNYIHIFFIVSSPESLGS